MFHNSLVKIEKVIGGRNPIVLCFSCPSRRYFRHDLWPDYKGNRKNAPPVLLGDLKAVLSSRYTTKTKPNLEADDVLGILATHPDFYLGDCVVVSPDKDLDQIPGLRFKPGGDDVYEVSVQEARRHIAFQALTGDSTDNYPGCPRIGPIRANRILDEVAEGASYVPAIQAAYERAGKTVEEMAVQLNVARILTAKTYNFKTGEPILWQPKKD